MKHFITVKWCNNGDRGVFCHQDGTAFWKDDGPHTDEEMREILDVFWLVLSPESHPLNEEELQRFSLFCPLAEYSGKYGIALHIRDQCPAAIAKAEGN